MRTRKSSVALRLLLLLPWTTISCAPGSSAGSDRAVCALPVVHHDATFGDRLDAEWTKLGAFSANEQLAGEHIRLQDAVEGQCGHRIGSQG
jgi:hypothetical protein